MRLRDIGGHIVVTHPDFIVGLENTYFFDTASPVLAAEGYFETCQFIDERGQAYRTLTCHFEHLDIRPAGVGYQGVRIDFELDTFEILSLQDVKAKLISLLEPNPDWLHNYDAPWSTKGQPAFMQAPTIKDTIKALGWYTAVSR